MSYYIATESKNDFEKTLLKVEDELKEEGFGILTEIDVQATLKKKLDVDFRRYKILGACNPPIAHQALSAEDKIGVMLPCNVIVQETDNGSVEVAMINPMEAMKSIKNDSMEEFAAMVTEKLQRVLDKI